jgi:hypothetical protein
MALESLHFPSYQKICPLSQVSQIRLTFLLSYNRIATYGYPFIGAWAQGQYSAY